MGKFRKKPIVIEAFCFLVDPMPDWFLDAVTNNTVTLDTDNKKCTIKTLEGEYLGLRGEYIIQGVHGELYPCKLDVFAATYDVVILDTNHVPGKIVEIGSRIYSEVAVLDEPGPGNAHHEYIVRPPDYTSPYNVKFNESKISFQNGPVKESGINGCYDEDLIAIVLHRLQSFQSGDFRCRENALVITKLEEAMHWLNHRTTARRDRGKSIV